MALPEVFYRAPTVTILDSNAPKHTDKFTWWAGNTVGESPIWVVRASETEEGITAVREDSVCQVLTAEEFVEALNSASVGNLSNTGRPRDIDGWRRGFGKQE